MVPKGWPPYLFKFIHAALWDDLAKTWLPYLRRRSPALFWREFGQTLAPIRVFVGNVDVFE